MPSVSHSELTADQLHVAFRWVQEDDPGSGADHPGHYWLKLTTGALKRRKDDDSGWDTIGGGGASNLRSAYADRPAAGTEGRIWLAEDSPISAFDDGDDWQEYFGSWPIFSSNGWPSTWVNQGIATVDSSLGGRYLSNAAASGANLRLQVKTLPTAPYTIIVGMLPQFLDVDYVSGGVALRDSSGGGIITAGPRTGSLMYIDKWSSPTSYSANYAQLPATHLPKSLVWIKIEDDTTNRIISISTNGYFWLTVHSVGNTDFITPNQIGVYVQAQNATYPVAAWFLSWFEGA